MARRCVVRTQANFFCWNFLSESSAPTSPLLFSSLSLSLRARQRPPPPSCGIIPGPGLSGHYYYRRVLPRRHELHSALHFSAALSRRSARRNERAAFLPPSSQSRDQKEAFVNMEHLALSLVRDQTGASGRWLAGCLTRLESHYGGEGGGDAPGLKTNAL